MSSQDNYWLSKEFIAELLFRLPSYVFWKDATSVYLGCNHAFARSVGLLDPKDIIGKTDYDLPWTKEESDAYRADDQAVMQSNQAKINIEETQTTRDGNKITLLTSKVPLIDKNGFVMGVLGIYNDITELKNTQNELIVAKEQAEAANKAKTEFVQNMQHDIRTPSSGLWGMLDFLVNSESDSDRKEALNMALAASKRLLDLCNDAVEFGDLSGNTRPRVERDLDIRALVKSIVELNKPAAFAKNIAIHLKIAPSVPPYIASDEFRLSRILINLLGNSIKFSNGGEITLSIMSSLENDTRKGVLIIEIRDMGIGIPRDKVDKIFEKFTRGIASNTNKYPGSGLGLYVVKTFIDELEGDIYVDSRENEGSYFKLDIPFKGLLTNMNKPGEKIDEYFNSTLKEKLKEKISKTNDAKQASKNKPFTHEILLIEDDQTCLFAEKQLMAAFTNKIDTAESVAEALKKLTVKHYDLVISDLGLPDGSGCDIVAHIKAAPESPNHKTLFVAMTAHNDEQKLRLAMNAGFSAVKVKPLTTEIAVELLNIYPVPGTEQPENEGLPVIDLALGMQRISVQEEGPAIEALGILYKTLQEDIPALQEAEQNNDVEKAREILHKIRGGLYYSGTPRLEESFRMLHDEVKHTLDLRTIDLLFSLAYGEVKLFAEEYKELVES
jgi:PAS domain S-box-containing protein